MCFTGGATPLVVIMYTLYGGYTPTMDIISALNGQGTPREDIIAHPVKHIDEYLSLIYKMNGKHSYSNLKPYEIVVRGYAPDNNNIEDLPAGFSRLQKRKWKVWYHVNDEYSPTEVIATYVRAGRRNEWILSSGGGSCPNDVVEYNNHFFLGRTAALGDCEIVKVNEGTYNCTTDEVFFIKPTQSGIANGGVLGWSQENGNWGDIQLRDNRSWTVYFNVLDTDGLGGVATSPVTQTFTSFYELINELNNQLITYGSSYRLVGATSGDAIFLTQIDGTLINSYSDPYIVLHPIGSIQIVIEDSVVGSGWLIKGHKVEEFEVINQEYFSGIGGLFKGTIPCIQGISQILNNKRGISGNNSTNPSTNYIGTGDAIPLLVKTQNILRMFFSANNGHIGINTNTPSTFLHIVSDILNDSGLMLGNLLFNQSRAVPNTQSIGVDNLGKVHIANSIGSADSRSINLQPQQTPCGYTFDFKQSSAIGLPTGTNVFSGLETWRRYGVGSDMIGGPVYQYATTHDNHNNNIKFERKSTSTTARSAWRKIPNQNFKTITTTGTLTIGYDIIQVNNSATNITITLVSPVIVGVGAEITISRGTDSTGTITIQPGAGQIESLANTLGATTSLALNGYGQNCTFISDGVNWLRKMNG